MNIFSRIKARCIEDANGCWVWQGARDPKGYGRIRVGGTSGRTLFTHRLMCKGLTDALHVDHLCNNTSCCNPAHLEAVTQQENNSRQVHANGNTYKTHCKRGHLLTQRDYRGHRFCRKCKNLEQNARYARERQAKDALRLHGPE